MSPKVCVLKVWNARFLFLYPANAVKNAPEEIAFSGLDEDELESIDFVVTPVLTTFGKNTLIPS
jgi:hypothetical protein